MTNSELLKEKIKESGYKIQHIADEIGLSRQALSNKINNNTQFTVEEMKAMSGILKVDGEEMKRIFFDD